MTRRAVQTALPLTVPPMPEAVQTELRDQIIPGWGREAACASSRFNPDWWFAPADDERQMVARGVCGTCPVRRSCLAHALASGEPHGIWGGFDESERAWVRLALVGGTPVASVLGPVGSSGVAA